MLGRRNLKAHFGLDLKRPKQVKYEENLAQTSPRGGIALHSTKKWEGWWLLPQHPSRTGNILYLSRGLDVSLARIEWKSRTFTRNYIWARIPDLKKFSFSALRVVTRSKYLIKFLSCTLWSCNSRTWNLGAPRWFLWYKYPSWM